MSELEMEDIKAAIEFYDSRGWDWGEIVLYLSMRYIDLQFLFPIPTTGQPTAP